MLYLNQTIIPDPDVPAAFDAYGKENGPEFIVVASTCFWPMLGERSLGTLTRDRVRHPDREMRTFCAAVPVCERAGRLTKTWTKVHSSGAVRTVRSRSKDRCATPSAAAEQHRIRHRPARRCTATR